MANEQNKKYLPERSGILIQARSGSTRLPAKILLPFDNETRIIDIILTNIKRSCPGHPIIVVTTINHNDDQIEEIAHKHGVYCTRGSENDVLDRFIQAADKFNLDRIIRVCSDNPFLVTDSFATLFAEHDKTPADYLAYSFPDGRPTIKSHLGLFAELATVDALKKAADLTTEQSQENKLYREHVTIFLYTHPELFNIKLLPLPEYLQSRTDLRLTLDTPSDFKLLQELYKKLEAETDHSIPSLLKLIDSNPSYGSIMKSNIAQNEK